MEDPDHFNLLSYLFDLLVSQLSLLLLIYVHHGFHP